MRQVRPGLAGKDANFRKHLCITVHEHLKHYVVSSFDNVLNVFNLNSDHILHIAPQTVFPNNNL